MNTLTTFDTVSARELQRDYKSIFSQVNRTNKPVVVISNNEPQGVILGLKELDKINKFFSEQKLWEAIRAIQSKNRYNDPITTQKDIDEAVEEAKQYVYNKTFGRSRHQRIYKRSTATSKRTRKSTRPSTQQELSK
jgi:prevent-host-death family protein